MTPKGIKRAYKPLLTDPYKQVELMLAVSTINEALQGMSTTDQHIVLSLYLNGITSVDKLQDILVEENIKDKTSSKKG